jgi:hypothetical protein
MCTGLYGWAARGAFLANLRATGIARQRSHLEAAATFHISSRLLGTRRSAGYESSCESYRSAAWTTRWIVASRIGVFLIAIAPITVTAQEPAAIP